MANNDEFDLPGDPSGRSFDELDRALDQDFDVELGGNSRNPVRNFTSNIADEMFSISAASSFVRRVGHDSLPKDYQDAYKNYTDVTDEVGKLYDHAMKEAKPAINSAKRIGRAIVPSLESFLPKSVYEKLQGIVAEDEQRGGSDPEEMEIASTLSGIFEAQAEQAVNQEKRADAREKTRDVVGKQQFEASLGVSNQIAQGISRLVGYQDNILIKYQRKTLEIQHRQYFATRQLLEVTRSTSEMLTAGIRDIVQNTSLPNEAKAANMGEMWFQESKRRLVGAGMDPLSKRMGGLGKRIGNNLRTQITEAMQGAEEVLSGAADLAEMSAETGHAGSVGKMIGQQGAKKMQDMAIKRLGPLLGGNESVKRGGHLLSFFGSNFWRSVNNQVKKGQDPDANMFQKALFNIVGAPEGADQIQVHKGLQEDQMSPVSWDILSRRTLIEVIPGFLGKILKQNTISNYLSNKMVENLYPGNKQYQRSAFHKRLNNLVPELTYSIKQERFITLKEKRRMILKDISGVLTDSSLNRIQETMLKELLAGKKKAVAPIVQQEISRIMMQDSIKGAPFDPYRFSHLTAAETPYYREINSIFSERFSGALDIFNPENTALEQAKAVWDFKEEGGEQAERMRKVMDQYKRMNSVAPELQDVFNNTTSAEDRHALGFTDNKGQFSEGLLALMNEYAMRGVGIDTPEKAAAFNEALKEKDPKKLQEKLNRIGFNFTPVEPAKTKRQIKKERKEASAKAMAEAEAAKAAKPKGKPKGAKGKATGGIIEYLASGGTAGRGFIDPTAATLTNTEDTVPTMLQPGEFVVPRHIVERYGVDFFNNISDIENNEKKSMWKRFKQTVKPKGTMMLNHAEQQTALLARIAKAVEHGYIAMPGGGVMQYGYFGQAGSDIKKAMQYGWDKVKSIKDSAVQLSKDSFSSFKDNIWNPGTRQLRVRGKMLKKWAKKKFSKGKEWITDLYIEGEQKVSLAYSKLKAGHYYYLKEDGEKVFLKDWKDLDGLTVDIYESTHDTIVVSKDQIEKLRSLQLPDVKGFFSKMKDKAGDLISSSMDFGGSLFNFARNVVSGAAKTIYRKLTAPVDVYVTGKIEEGPRLRRILFLNGGYRDNAGNIIDHHDKINGPVFALNGSGKVEEVLTQEDIKSGLIELDGTPIEGTGLFGRVVNKASKILDKGIKFAKGIIKGGMKLAGNVAGAVAGVAAGGLSALGSFGSSGVESRLDKIIKHMRIIHPLTAEDQALIDKEIPRSSMSAALRDKWKEWKLKDKAKGQWDKMKESEMANKVKEFKEKVKSKGGVVAAVSTAIADKKASAIEAKRLLKEQWNKRRDQDGDGFIKGSWEEMKKQMEEKKKAREAAKAGMMGPPKPPDEKGGIMKILDGLKGFAMALAAPFSSIFKIISGLGTIMGGALKIARFMGKPLGLAMRAGGFIAKRLVWPVARFALTSALRVGATALAGAVGIPGLIVAGIALVGYMAWKGYKYYKAKKNLEPLTKLRFLQYGLPETSGSEANNPFAIIKQATKAYFGKEDARVAIHYLEDWSNENIKIEANGSFVPPKFEDIWKKFHKDFDCEEDNETHQKNFKQWFYKRYLPIYAYHVLAARNTGQCTIQEADAKVPIKNKADYIKRITFGAAEVMKFGIDPYNVLTSPWPNTALQSNKETVKLLSEAIKEASDAGTDLNPNASKVIDAKQKQNVKDIKNESKVVKKATFGRFLRDITLRMTGQSEKADQLLIKDEVLNKKTGAQRLASPPKFKAGQASVSTTKEAKELQEYMFAAAQAAGLKDDELAIFMANVHHESGGFKRLTENFNYKPEALLATFPRKIKSIEEARKLVQGGEMAIANHIYGGVNGNKGPMDGYMYAGKGFIQLTGRENYEAAGKALGLDLINNPNLATDPANAAKIALWYWKSRGISEAIKGSGSFQEKMIIARKKINGTRMLGLEETGALATEYNKWVADKWAAKANEVKTPVATPAPSNQAVNKGEAQVAQGQPAAAPPKTTAAIDKAEAAPVAPPVVNVSAPATDLAPVAKTVVEVGDKAAEQREKQILQGQELIDVMNRLAATQTALLNNNGKPVTKAQIDAVLEVQRKNAAVGTAMNARG